MDVKEVRAALAYASAEVLAGLAGCIRECAGRVEMVTPARLAVVMVRARESVEGSPFNLGELLISECTASVDGTLGYGAIVGDNPGSAEALALVDAVYRSSDRRWEDVRKHLQGVADECRTQKAARDTDEFSRVARTKVSFEAMQDRLG